MESAIADVAAISNSVAVMNARNCVCFMRLVSLNLMKESLAEDSRGNEYARVIYLRIHQTGMQGGHSSWRAPSVILSQSFSSYNVYYVKFRILP
jgi:hypothetical protein